MASHPNKHIRAAVALAQQCGWSVSLSGGHAWGVIRCPAGCCQHSVWSTPRVPEHHAARIRRYVATCPGRADDE